MFQSNTAGGLPDRKNRTIDPEKLNPTTVYRLHETSLGNFVDEHNQLPSQDLTGADIITKVRRGSLHALRNYRVEGPDGVSHILNHLPGRVDSTLTKVYH